MSGSFLQFARVADDVDALAPDGSEIRLLTATERASAVHCRLPPGAVSFAVRHRRVEETWFCLRGRGEIWRRDGETERVDPLEPNVALTIPAGTSFQFRNLGSEPLDLFLVTVPPWPGEQEAVRVAGRWPAQ